MGKKHPSTPSIYHSKNRNMFSDLCHRWPHVTKEESHVTQEQSHVTQEESHVTQEESHVTPLR